MGWKVHQTLTDLTTDTASEWILLPSRTGNNTDRIEKFVIQGYWQGADTLSTGVVDLYFTLNTTLASSVGMEDVFSNTMATMLTTDGVFGWSVDNNGYNACRVKYTKYGITTLGTMVIGLSFER